MYTYTNIHIMHGVSHAVAAPQRKRIGFGSSGPRGPDAIAWVGGNLGPEEMGNLKIAWRPAAKEAKVQHAMSSSKATHLVRLS